MTTPTEKLNSVERLRLLHLEKYIRNGMASTIATWVALEEVRDRRLYRETHRTFDDYCQNKWNMSRRYADMLIKNAVVVKELPKEMRSMLLNPRQTEALKKVEPEKRVEVLKLAAGKGAVTAASITKAAVEFKKPVDVYDETGCKIPVDLLGLWHRREEVNGLLKDLSRVKCHIDSARSRGDLLYIEIRDSLIADLKMAREAVSYALPYAVCPTCQGKNTGKCTFCKGRGIVSEQLYLKADKKLRDMREKFGKKGAK